MKPVIKYRGGKAKEIPYYKSYIPNYKTYFEPFFGGGATYFDLEPENAYIGDVNEALIKFYEGIASKKFEKIKNELLELQTEFEKNRKIFVENKKKYPNERVNDPNEVLYYKIRDMYNSKIPSQYEYSTLYYFINKSAYSGMIRYNKNGEFNVPYGRYANFNTALLTNKHHNLLANSTIYQGGYEVAFNLATSKDFIFLDPPYDTVFSDYGNEVFTGDFGEFEHQKLSQDFKNLSAPAMMIISETPLINSLYKEFIRGSYEKKYSVNIRNRFQSKANHLIITNYSIEKFK